MIGILPHRFQAAIFLKSISAFLPIQEVKSMLASFTIR